MILGCFSCCLCCAGLRINEWFHESIAISLYIYIYYIYSCALPSVRRNIWAHGGSFYTQIRHRMHIGARVSYAQFVRCSSTTPQHIYIYSIAASQVASMKCDQTNDRIAFGYDYDARVAIVTLHIHIYMKRRSVYSISRISI